MRPEGRTENKKALNWLKFKKIIPCHPIKLYLKLNSPIKHYIALLVCSSDRAKEAMVIHATTGNFNPYCIKCRANGTPVTPIPGGYFDTYDIISLGKHIT